MSAPKIDDLIKQKEFVKQLQNVTDYNRVIELFEQNGVQIAKEEAKTIITAMSNKDELDEEMLSGVFGGANLPQWLRNLLNGKKKGSGTFNGGGGGGGGHGF